MNEKLVLVGASTGGPGQLKYIFSNLPHNIKTPIVVAQHMGINFIPSFANQFNSELKVPVFLLDTKHKLDKGGIYICERNFILNSSGAIVPKKEDEKTIYNPNVDLLFNSAIGICKEKDILAILLTGIGHDGADGLLNLANHGAKTIAENEDSAIVYGMPKQAKKLNPNLKMLHINEIKKELEDFIDVF